MWWAIIAIIVGLEILWLRPRVFKPKPGWCYSSNKPEDECVICKMLKDVAH